MDFQLKSCASERPDKEVVKAIRISRDNAIYLVAVNDNVIFCNFIHRGFHWRLHSCSPFTLLREIRNLIIFNIFYIHALMEN